MKLKVFTFNLRCDNNVDGINAFPNRKERILETIRTHAPDLIGFQEAMDHMRVWLRNELGDYIIVGCGRNSEYRGESVVIAYRKDKFEALWSENFWLSATPGIPGTVYGFDQSSCPRVTTAVCLKHRDAKVPFIFCNTHLDHKGKTARLFGSMQLLQYLSSKPYKFVLTGDFNALPDAPEIKLLTDVKNYPVVDATAELGGTFHGFGKLTDKIKIDYIFTNLETDPAESFIVPDDSFEGIYISDHHPVCAFVDIGE